jgi:hypothetical protein
MQFALERDEALALLEPGRTPKRPAALSRLTCHEHHTSNRLPVRRAAARRAQEKTKCSAARATRLFGIS